MESAIKGPNSEIINFLISKNNQPLTKHDLDILFKLIAKSLNRGKEFAQEITKQQMIISNFDFKSDDDSVIKSILQTDVGLEKDNDRIFDKKSGVFKKSSKKKKFFRPKKDI
ncbi:hypothetical protein TCON_1072 [Astathelohania contejeani]|uniref:Uncharacterized protein n=1 Tax=Astathelohania contejeani TaxID=164912 RepID=A0ABQ7HZZ8_9MICR|nr:hypothetical protein TCON_1072 [Thelohania contejeani]